MISIIPFSILPFGDRNFTKKVYENFLNIYCLITMISLLVWCLYLFDMAPMLGTISPLNELKQYNYNVYPFLVCASNSPRFCSVFDEPGVVGTISGILLCCQKFKLKDIRTIILLITGLCSTSMFFYILCAIYIVLYYLMVEKKLQGVILSIIIIISSLYIIQSNTILNEAIGYRFQWDSETGKMVGDNRTDELVLYYFTMLFGGGMVPNYLLLTKYLHLNNTIWVYIFPGLVSAFNLIIIRTNYRSLPEELIEAAKIDGASELYICFKKTVLHFDFLFI